MIDLHFGNFVRLSENVIQVRQFVYIALKFHMGNNIPQFDSIKYFKFYNLHKLGWMFENSNTSIEHNAPIIERITNDFADTNEIDTEVVKQAFDVDYIHTNRSSEGILLLYTRNDNSQVFRYFTNANTETYKVLSSQ